MYKNLKRWICMKTFLENYDIKQIKITKLF